VGGHGGRQAGRFARACNPCWIYWASASWPDATPSKYPAVSASGWRWRGSRLGRYAHNPRRPVLNTCDAHDNRHRTQAPVAGEGPAAGLLPETPEEHRRRGDAADALWRELVRRVAEKT